MICRSALILSLLVSIGCSSFKQESQPPPALVPPAKPSITANSLIGQWVSTNLTCADGKVVDSKGRLSIEITADTFVFGVKEGKKTNLDKYGPWMLQGEILTLQSAKQLSSIQIAKPTENILTTKIELKAIKGLCPKGEITIEFTQKPETISK